MEMGGAKLFRMARKKMLVDRVDESEKLKKLEVLVLTPRNRQMRFAKVASD
jgi:hypothetical protein